jgi:BirA family biotin operon repressor/biotin-[acetyl-CoA-carboxylase] ligase
MKIEILQLLRKNSQPISGEKLSSTLGVSRVTIWKHIKALLGHGYDIAATPKGYQLISGPDTPFPWEFPGREKNIHFFESVESTMDVARDLARKGCPHLTVVVADIQGEGRGRMRRVWHSETGGLYFTLVIRLSMPPQYIGRVNFYTSWALAETLRHDYGVKADVKWPNDILIDGRKLCGMLSEMEAEGDMTTFLNIGIGINVNNNPTPLEPRAVSLTQLLQRPVDRKELLAKFLDRFEQNLEQAMSESVIDRWKIHNTTLGRTVRVQTHKETIEGTALDVDSNGELLVKQADGSIKKIIYGDCFHL